MTEYKHWFRVYCGQPRTIFGIERTPIYADDKLVGYLRYEVVMQRQYGAYFELNDYGRSLGIEHKGCKYGFDAMRATAKAIGATWGDICNNSRKQLPLEWSDELLKQVVGQSRLNYLESLK